MEVGGEIEQKKEKKEKELMDTDNSAVIMRGSSWVEVGEGTGE